MNIQPTDTFSTQLEVCYEVLLFLSTRMQRLAPGEILEFISCDPDAPRAVEEWTALRSYELLAVEALEDGQTRFLIRR
ncbi:MAG: sulfurtransferase TusA family protein [Anaerolineae bacterium]|nr:sulfurtransferase TusA family protein [Anaerolineae bacterium]